jgi:hypothetical protein
VPANSSGPKPQAGEQPTNPGKTKTMKTETKAISLNVEELEERIAPDTVGALHNNPSNPNNNNNHNAVPNGNIPEGPAGN